MCWFGQDNYKPGTGPPPVRPEQDVDTTLPTTQDLVDEDSKAETDFGSEKKDSTADNRPSSADSLRIDLNTGGESGTGTNTGGYQ